MFVRFRVHGASAAAADVSAHLMNKAGATLSSLSLAALPGPEKIYEIDVPVASIARGDYLIAIAAAHAANSIPDQTNDLGATRRCQPFAARLATDERVE